MALIWGLNFPVIKATLDQLPPLAFNAVRFPLASLAVLLILRSRGPLPRPRASDWPRILLLGILGNVVYQGFFIFGIDGTLAGNASILLATIPIWTVALSTLRGHERPGLVVWAGVLATVTGMTILVLGGRLALDFRGGTLLGDLLVVGAAMTWSLYTVGSRRVVHRYGSLPVTAWTLWIGTVGLTVLGLPSLLATPLSVVTPAAWGGAVYSGVMGIGIAYLLWYRGVRRIGSSRTAAYQNLVPVVALAVAWLWLGEVPTSLQILGAAVVLGGLTLARLGRDRA
jgi:drug/metabolite transporter (DMT)-like permease